MIRKHWKQTVIVIAVVGVLGFIIFSLYCGLDTTSCLKPFTIETVSEIL